MKKTRKFLLTMLSVLTVAAVSFGAASCELLEILSQSIPPINIPTWDKSSLDNSTGDSSSGSSSMENSSSEDSSSAHTEHTWAESYSYDDSYHWIECNVCHEVKDKAEHTLNETGECSVCKAWLRATEGILYEVSSNGTYAQVIGYEGTAARVRIADMYEGLPVKTICEKAFNNNDNITSVIIPDSVTSIGDYAFSGCSSLTSVEIPDSVTSIGHGAFGCCSSLTSVVIGNSVTSIGDGAFYNCSSLTSVEIGDSVTLIGEGAFSDCSSLTSIVIPDSVTSIGDWAFYNCRKLVEVVNRSTHITVEKGESSNGYVGYYALAVYNSGDTYESILSYDDGYIIYTDGEEKILVGYTGTETDLLLPAYLTKIYQYAFFGCRNLTSVVIGDSVTSIGSEAFAYCSSLTSVVIGDSVTSIGERAFTYCSSLTIVEIPDSVTSIGNGAFTGCSSLTSVAIGNSVTLIDEFAFANCHNLVRIEIPDSVTSIKWGAFDSCDNLTTIYYQGTASEWSAISISSVDNSSLMDATKYYYSETEPAEEGNYWHYVDGVPTKW